MELSTAERYKQINALDIADLLGVSRSTVWQYVKDGILPEPRYLKPRQPKWQLGEVIDAYEGQLLSAKEIAEGASGLARAQAPTKTTSENPKPESAAQKLKKRFGLS